MTFPPVSRTRISVIPHAAAQACDCVLTVTVTREKTVAGGEYSCIMTHELVLCVPGTAVEYTAVYSSNSHLDLQLYSCTVIQVTSFITTAALRKIPLVTTII